MKKRMAWKAVDKNKGERAKVTAESKKKRLSTEEKERNA